MPFLANIFSCFAMEKSLKLAPFGTPFLIQKAAKRPPLLFLRLVEPVCGSVRVCRLSTQNHSFNLPSADR
jgi:hypothetical protein